MVRCCSAGMEILELPSSFGEEIRDLYSSTGELNSAGD